MKFIYTVIALAMILTLSLPALAQSRRITGMIRDSQGQPLPGASVVIKGQLSGATADGDGRFSLNATHKGTVTLAISMVGHERQELAVGSSDQPVEVRLATTTSQLDEVVVGASRVEERLLRAPVTIEKMDVRAIRETPSASFYEGINNLKGVDMVTSGLTYRQINTRGFASTGNSRFLQLIDGIDNQPAGFGFSVGNMFGLSDLDAESVELVPGAASALYGPAAFNGVLLMTSKDPFRNQGLSVQSKVGVNHLGDANTGAAIYTDHALRYARAFGSKFAFKLNASYMAGLDWFVGSSRVDLQACKLEYSIVSPK